MCTHTHTHQMCNVLWRWCDKKTLILYFMAYDQQRITTKRKHNAKLLFQIDSFRKIKAIHLVLFLLVCSFYLLLLLSIHGNKSICSQFIHICELVFMLFMPLISLCSFRILSTDRKTNVTNSLDKWLLNGFIHVLHTNMHIYAFHISIIPIPYPKDTFFSFSFSFFSFFLCVYHFIGSVSLYYFYRI